MKYRVQECIDEVKEIKHIINHLARTQELAVFECYGVDSSEFLSPEVSSEEELVTLNMKGNHTVHVHLV